MKFLFKSKDGGKDSNVTGYWLFESKRFGSIVLLRFDKGSREAFHNHAFNAVSWVLKGELMEEFAPCHMLHGFTETIKPSWKPFRTHKTRFHRVFGMADTTWAISFRGPWDKTWEEWLPNEQKYVTLTNGRRIVEEK